MPAWHRSAVNWILGNERLHGEGYVRTAYTQFVTDTGLPVPPERFLEYVNWVTGKVPQKSFQVTSPSESLAFHSVDTTKHEITGIRVNTWGNEANPNQQVRIDLKPKAISIGKVLEDFRAEVQQYIPAERTKRTVEHSGLMAELSIPDLHFGQLSWGAETGMGDWDLKIAREQFLQAVNKMLDWIEKRGVEKILFPIMGDFFNSDNHMNATSAGTPQTEDQRWMKTFSTGWKLVRDAIELCSQVAPVDVVVIRGNHDMERSYYMGEVLSAWFKNDQNVSIDNTPLMYKVRAHGSSMIGLTHGQGCKMDKLTQLYACDYAKLWGETKHREIHIGHLHQDMTKEFPGCKVVVVPALVSGSEWSASSGMRSRRGAKGFLWDKEHGRVETLDYSPI